MLDFCACNNVVVTNTFLRYCPCQQMSWFHPAEGMKRGHMIDCVLINQHFRTCILDTRGFCETYLHSDHMLVGWKVCFRLKANRCGCTARLVYQLNRTRLNEDQVGTFQQKLGSSLGQLAELASPEQIWGQFKSFMLSTQQSLPGVSNQKHIDWITDELCALSQLKKQHCLYKKTKEVAVAGAFVNNGPLSDTMPAHGGLSRG